MLDHLLEPDDYYYEEAEIEELEPYDEDDTAPLYDYDCADQMDRAMAAIERRAV